MSRREEEPGVLAATRGPPLPPVLPSIGRHRQGRIGRSLLPDAHLVVRAKTHTGWWPVPPWRARSRNRHNPEAGGASVGLGLHPQDEALDRPDPDAGSLADGAVHRPGAPERPLHQDPALGVEVASGLADQPDEADLRRVDALARPQR